MKKTLITAATISLVASILHLPYELIHMRLFECDLNSWGCLKLCSLATLGDVIMTLSIWLVLLLTLGKQLLVIEISPRFYLLVGFIGLLYAIIFEQFALLNQRWQYLESMPVLPILNVGLTPLIQMAILTPLIFYITHKISLKYL